MRLTAKEKKSLHLLFASVAADKDEISTVDFFRLCKLLKVYPNYVPFEQLKRIVLKDPAYWKQKRADTGTTIPVSHFV